MALTPLRKGFTLIEVLVVLLILSILAAAAWKGVDAISRAREVAEDNLQVSLRLQSVMAQWEVDLAQVIDTQVVPGLEFDGAALRLTRKDVDGVRVVAWALRGGRLLRWASAPALQVGALKRAWQASYGIQGQEAGLVQALPGVSKWQVFCFRSGALSNCQSSGDQTGSASSTKVQMPEAVRVQMDLADGAGLSGSLQRDVLVAPQPN